MKGVEARLRGSGVSERVKAARGKDGRAALEHGGERGRRRCARAALGEREGARRRLGTAVGDRGGEKGARRRRLGVQASGGEWWWRGGGYGAAAA